MYVMKNDPVSVDDDGDVGDGAIIMCHAIGRSVRDEENPQNSILTLAATFETGDERFQWMNHKVLMGKGEKKGSTIKVDYFDISISG
mmetsp:Transcript_109238/g.163392  ORF Transcript_109238/g.163392 Transcript_109238/m.163392 type:complete len:87 (-) Transcript_109238:218-478(-)